MRLALHTVPPSCVSTSETSGYVEHGSNCEVRCKVRAGYKPAPKLPIRTTKCTTQNKAVTWIAPIDAAKGPVGGGDCEKLDYSCPLPAIDTSYMEWSSHNGCQEANSDSQFRLAPGGGHCTAQCRVSAGFHAESNKKFNTGICVAKDQNVGWNPSSGNPSRQICSVLRSH